MGDPPLARLQGMGNLKDHMQRRNLITIWDISELNPDGSWKSWDIPCLIQMEIVKEQFLTNLKGKSHDTEQLKIQEVGGTVLVVILP